MSTALFENLTNEELRGELGKHGVQVGPLTVTTRKVYEIRLLKIVQKKENAEDFVQNLSISDKNSHGATPEPNITVPADHGDVGSNGFMSLRSGSPMTRKDSPAAQNGPPFALNGSLVLRSGSPVLNGISTESSKKVAIRNAREKKLLLNNTSEVFVTMQESSGVGTVDGMGPVSKQKTCVEEDNHDYSDDDANESARTLSPEEVAIFRSGFSSSYNNTNELFSGIASGATSGASSSVFSLYSLFSGHNKRRPPLSAVVSKPVKGGLLSLPASSAVIGVALFFIIAVVLLIIYQTNLAHHYGFNSGAHYNDEI